MVDKAIIVAEIGQNYCGSMELAELLIVEAKDNGADLVKFQLFDSQKLYGKKIEAELTFEQAEHLFDFGVISGIEVFFSVFDTERVKWCEQIGVKRYKVSYSNKDNQKLLKAIDDTGKPKWVSGKDLYCVPHYPTLPSELDFNKLNRYMGYSDHTVGLMASQVALVKGAKVIEKHFALNHHLGVDSEWSITPDELRELRMFTDKVKEF